MSIDYKYIHTCTMYILPCVLFSDGLTRSSLFSCRFIVGGESLEQLVNSRAPELAIYLRTYLRASFHRSGVNRLFAPVFSSCIGHLNCIAGRCIKSFEDKGGCGEGSSKPSRTPPPTAYGPVFMDLYRFSLATVSSSENNLLWLLWLKVQRPHTEGINFSC